jgi:hypothetical protein
VLPCPHDAGLFIIAEDAARVLFPCVEMSKQILFNFFLVIDDGFHAPNHLLRRLLRQQLVSAMPTLLVSKRRRYSLTRAICPKVTAVACWTSQSPTRCR